MSEKFSSPTYTVPNNEIRTCFCSTFSILDIFNPRKLSPLLEIARTSVAFFSSKAI